MVTPSQYHDGQRPKGSPRILFHTPAQQTPIKIVGAGPPPQLWRPMSSIRVNENLHFDVLVHIAGAHSTDIRRLEVHRSISLISFRAMIQRECGIPFENQQLSFQRENLEGDEELISYAIQHQSVLVLNIRKHYRSIGDVFAKIKTVQFTSTSHPEDYEIVEVIAPLPPLRIIFRRLAIIIAYLMMPDCMQFSKTNRHIWRQHVQFWDEPIPVHSLNQSHNNPKLHTVNHRKQSHRQGTLSTLFVPTSQTSPSFVLQQCMPESVSNLIALARTHAIPERLQLSSAKRTPSDIRHIKKWLMSLTYFSNVNVPDSVFHEIAKSTTYARYRSGDYIFRQGEVGDFFYIVISGCVAMAAFGTGLFATMTPGKCFGELSLFIPHGRRMASANVNFTAPYAELAVLSGEIYRRIITPYKQAMLQNTKKSIASIPQLRTVSEQDITNIAYGAKTLMARPGKRLIRHGDEVNVLVLLVKGEVKVTTPHHRQLNHSKQDEKNDSTYPVICAVRAPAVFGQEGSLLNTPVAALWDIDAFDSCTLVCFRMDTISVFLSRKPEIIRALVHEHQSRVSDFYHRFYTAQISQLATRTVSDAALSNVTSSVHLRDTKPHLHQWSQDDAKATTARKKSLYRMQNTVMHLPLLDTLFKSPDVPTTKSDTPRPATSPRRTRSMMKALATAPPTRSRPLKSDFVSTKRTTSLPTCAEMQNNFLHLSFPHAAILNLQEQLLCASIEHQNCFPSSCRYVVQIQDTLGSQDDEQCLDKTNVLLNGLRRVPAEDVGRLPLSSCVGLLDG